MDTINLSDEGACYNALLSLLHPEGLACPRCKARTGLGVHRRHRAPVVDYQCAACGRVFNAWADTPLEKTHRSPSQILRLLYGILQAKSTAQLARELGAQRAQLLVLRRRLEPLARTLAGKLTSDSDESGQAKSIAWEVLHPDEPGDQTES